ncbi:alpha/beta hydrolase [Aliiglaciecola sp. M165]|uniref:alpha/beta hydrolase n=1 Tax=Aliiglaciecola sp. M165 TaxID=2593649 RepID=UPI001180B25D|nr:alpha/beta hydrolase [Aliiglaciecola sp. M165]TRY32127.1 alpha/beta hydrolase [Aliiglaciecola sp. M165]
MNQLLASILLLLSSKGFAEDILDNNRDRTIPIEITAPSTDFDCSIDSKCAVVFLSAGYGVPHTKYKFLAKTFSKLGYLVVAIGHELPSDPPLSVSGDLFQTRAENWIRGAETLKVVRNQLRTSYLDFDFDNLVLAGHSNGGDISAWLLRESPLFVSQIITLDHRRVPLPRTKDVKVLTIRASDFEADNGVLPTHTEQTEFGSCVVKIDNSRHNDMSDFGPALLKLQIQKVVTQWLSVRSCDLRG